MSVVLVLVIVRLAIRIRVRIASTFAVSVPRVANSRLQH